MYIPSSVGPLRDLSECLRAEHDARRAWVLTKIEERKAKGIPLDDSTDFGALEGRLSAVQAAVAQMDGATLRTALVDMLGRVSGGLADPGEYKPRADYEGVSVRIRPLTERRRLELNRAFQQATTLLEQNAACREFAAVSIAEVVGLESDDGSVALKADGERLSEDMLDLLDRGDMLGDLFVAVKAYHEVDAAKKKHFGLLPPSTSLSSIAPAALSGSVTTEAATATPAPSGGSPSRTGPVLDGTGSTTQKSESGTASTAPQKGSSALPVSL